MTEIIIDGTITTDEGMTVPAKITIEYLDNQGLYIPGPAYDAIRVAAPTHLADLITALEREQRIREVHTPERVELGQTICPECSWPDTIPGQYLHLAPYPLPDDPHPRRKRVTP